MMITSPSLKKTTITQDEGAGGGEVGITAVRALGGGTARGGRLALFGDAGPVVGRRPIRDHGDVDVLVLCRDRLHVQRVLQGWEWWAADPPGTLRRWAPGERLTLGVHDIWCRTGRIALGGSR